MTAETEEFAALLRMLKERSGKSYGRLAGRLHVSTSTLHRYCHGTAVPAEYGPVERFARLCGAAPEELLDLHRSWLLADASRRREARRSAGAAAAETGDSPTGSPDDLPSCPSGPAPASGAGLRQETLVAAFDPGPVAGGSRRRQPRPWMVGTAALGAMAALCLPLLTPGRPQHPVAAATSDTRSATGATSGLPRGTPSGPGSSSTATASATTSVSASATASATASASGASSRAAASAGAAGSQAATAAPLQISVLDNNWDDPCGRWYLAPKSPAAVPPPPDPDQSQNWAATLGALPAGHLRLEITVQGTGGQPVILHHLYVHARHSGPAPHWSAYNMGVGCGGGVVPAAFTVDLDSAEPLAIPTTGAQGDSTVPAPAFPYLVSPSQPEVLDIDATTTDQDVYWSLELVWSSGSRQGTAVIDDNGNPFRTVGRAGDPRYVYPLGGSGWTTDPDPNDP